MFSVAHGQSKTNINLCRQGMIQLRRTPFLVYYLLSHNYTLKVQTLSQVCLGLKIDFCKFKLRLKISLSCQTVSFGHLHFSSV